MWDNVRDAGNNLGGTIIRYDGELVYVSDVYGEDNDIRMNINNLLNNSTSEVHLNDPLLNFKPVPLGYAFYNGHAVFLARVPKRRWKTGLDRNNVVMIDQEFTMRPFSLNSRTHEALDRCVKGLYDTVESAKKKLATGDIRSIPVSRHFALSHMDASRLLYMGTTVGTMEDNRPVFTENFSYLDGQYYEEVCRD